MSRLKDLTGGSKISARGLQDKNMTTWDQTPLLFLLTNEVPRMKSDDDAFWSRTHFVHWPVRFVDRPQAPDERKRDPGLSRKLEAEASGILATLVRGCMDYLENGLNPPEKVLNYTQEQRDQFDDIGQFLEAACDREDPPGPGQDWKTKVATGELVKICNWWREKNLGDSYAYGAKHVTQVFKKKGIISKKISVMYYLGLSVKDEVQAEYDAAVEENQEKERRR